MTFHDLGYHTRIVSKVFAVPVLSSSPVRPAVHQSVQPTAPASADQDYATQVPASLLCAGKGGRSGKWRGVRLRLAAVLAIGADQSAGL